MKNLSFEIDNYHRCCGSRSYVDVLKIEKIIQGKVELVYSNKDFL